MRAYHYGMWGMCVLAAECVDISYPVAMDATSELAQAQWLAAARFDYPDSPLGLSDIGVYLASVEDGQKHWRVSVDPVRLVGASGGQPGLWVGVVNCGPEVWEQVRLQSLGRLWRHRVPLERAHTWTQDALWQSIQAAYPNWEAYTLVCQGDRWAWYQGQNLWAEGEAGVLPVPQVRPAASEAVGRYRLSVAFSNTDSLARCLNALKANPAVQEIAALGVEQGAYQMTLRLRGITPKDMLEWSEVTFEGEAEGEARYHVVCQDEGATGVSHERN